MTEKMTTEQLQAVADFYGIDLQEARWRHAVLIDHGDNPDDPICVGCARRPTDILGYIDVVQEDPDNPPPSPEAIRLYVINNEGTYNRRNGHFLCDECYIRNGMPSSDRGWVCP